MASGIQKIVRFVYHLNKGDMEDRLISDNEIRKAIECLESQKPFDIDELNTAIAMLHPHSAFRLYLEAENPELYEEVLAHGSPFDRRTKMWRKIKPLYESILAHEPHK